MTYPGPLSGDSYHVIPAKESKTLVVFFSGTGKNNGKFDFWRVGKEINEHVLFINNGRNEWYQRGVPGLGKSVEETGKTMLDWADTLGAEHIVMFGASMGGYGAALFGTMLGARVLAFGIDTMLKIPGSRSLKQMPRDVELVHPDLVPIINGNGTPIHLYVGEMDPMDIVGASRLIDSPSVTIQSIRGVNHRTARFFLQHVGLVETMEAFIYGEPLPPIPYEGRALQIPELVEPVYDAHLAMIEGNWPKVVDAARVALRIDPDFETAHYFMGRGLLKTGETRRAVEHLAFVAENLPECEEGDFYHAHALRLVGQEDVALDLLEAHVRKWPKSAPAWLNISKIHEKAGRLEAAFGAMFRAARLEPKHYDNLDKLTDAVDRHLDRTLAKAAPIHKFKSPDGTQIVEIVGDDFIDADGQAYTLEEMKTGRSFRRLTPRELQMLRFTHTPGLQHEDEGEFADAGEGR